MIHPKNPEKFFAHIRVNWCRGVLSESQVAGVNAILAAWPDNTDLRIGANALATAFWETDYTFQPVAEIGHGKGYAYGRPAGPNSQSYYGRGYVQMTWFRNYARADDELHHDGTLKPEESLIKTPDLALRPDIAAHVMVRGMTEGWFGPPIGAFFNAKSSMWALARRNINGNDNAARIGAMAQDFFMALQA